MRSICGSAFSPFLEQSACDGKMYLEFLAMREGEMTSIKQQILHFNNALSESARRKDYGACEEYRRRIFMLNAELVDVSNKTAAYVFTTRAVNSVMEQHVYQELMTVRLGVIMKLRVHQSNGANLGCIPFGEI